MSSIADRARARLADTRSRWTRARVQRLLRMSNAQLRARLAQRARAALRSEEELIILRKRLDAAAMTPPEPGGTLVLEDLEARHLPELHELNVKRNARWKDAVFAENLERGYRGLVGYRDGVLVGYYWWADHAHAEGHPDFARYQLDLPLAPDGIYGFDFYILDAHRGAGRAIEFLDRAEWRLGELGYRDLWGYVIADNRPARWLYTMRRYEPAGRMTVTTVLGRRRLTARTEATSETAGSRG